MAKSEQRYRYRAQPQVSAAQIAEYLEASSTRRKSIIREARFPKTSIISQYSVARDGLVKFLDDGTRSFRHIADVMDKLEKRAAAPSASEWIGRDSRQSMEAIDAFQRGYNKVGLQKLDCRRPHGRLPHLNRFRTKISVDIDVLTQKQSKEGPPQIGGIIYLFSRGGAIRKGTPSAE